MLLTVVFFATNAMATNETPEAAPNAPVLKMFTPKVTIESGIIEGQSLEQNIFSFKGIPYAAPPVGKLRWQPPQPVEPWKNPKSTIAYGATCPQPDMSELIFKSYRAMAEDCLYLNVWTPAIDSSAAKLPVMVWIHGGGFIVGTASDDYYTGQDLAKSGVVVVTLNYRLGPFGFFAHPLLSQESEHKVSGNYGLLDQIAALQWVQKNIKSFGGDAENITLFGESAGGRSIASLMVSPLSKGLFHKAILQSSTVFRPMYHLTESWYGRPSMENVGLQLAAALDADKEKDVLAALRQLSVDEIMKEAKPTLPGMLEGKNKKQDGIAFEPAVDGWVLPGSPSDLFDAGKQHPIPIIAGSNADEGSLFARKISFLTARRARKIIEEVFAEDAPQILKLYPFDDRDAARTALNRIAGDMNSAAPMDKTVSDMTRINSPAWLYYYTHVREDELGQKLGAWHGSEIRMVFNSLDRGKAKITDADRKVAATISQYWLNFAKTGNPNGSGLPDWPQYKINEAKYLEIAAEPRVGNHLRQDKVDFFAALELKRRQARSKN